MFLEFNASSVIFVIFIFRIAYEKYISLIDWIGMGLITIAIFDISYLGNFERDKEEDDQMGPDDPAVDRT